MCAIGKVKTVFFFFHFLNFILAYSCTVTCGKYYTDTHVVECKRIMYGSLYKDYNNSYPGIILEASLNNI
jgi:hypothetical protein